MIDKILDLAVFSIAFVATLTVTVLAIDKWQERQRRKKWQRYEAPQRTITLTKDPQDQHKHFAQTAAPQKRGDPPKR